ncbi:UbiH/UbiF/VisC/COQ6 family ubiquinone biosynthesis hydroxylase [Glaciecola sp. XM2]|uniref:UbiH/UbiF/VisC/COQ6 family ubiquinone biosynthesis hydroxylase n=1 Tax=Glaciecola sp. XM2 TaxID=1914931 RepID=UPI001BDE9E60|nr:UbiH/UbiF/VisC/COQ6 family ubiquinone biosynthesis hydroxylase [Glaciecola sp. XM2]MBT1450550.1 UbiH/UbiF/VisC/COQ6 family ubiquinone biosynthesis hydroxylase [Glaciecola sp. XM2]
MKQSNKKPAKTPLIKQADIVIAGAGIVGQTLALELGTTGLSVLVIDAQKSLECKVEQPFSPRVSAISAASQHHFERLGAWENIARKQAYTHMQVWEQDGFGKIDFDNADIGLDALGHIIENDQLAAALYNTAKAHPNIEYALGNTIEKLVHTGDEYHIGLDDGAIIIARLLVGADGGNSFVRRSLSFKQSFWDYDHTAIVANVQTKYPHELTARQVFTPTGPLAFLPLGKADDSRSQTCSIVWSQETEAANRLLGMDAEAFCKALSVAIDMQLGPCELITDRFSYPLTMRYARQWVDESIALVGDAAHTIHPLAGQGANLGIGDAVALAANIQTSLDDGKPFFSKQRLRAYERERKAQAQKVIATMEGFKRLFDGDDPLKKLIRNVGLTGANTLTPIKQFFIEQAQGE